MRFHTQAVLALGCVTMTALSIPAFSRPNPQGLEQDPTVRVVRIPQPAPGQAAKKPTLTYKKRIHRKPHVIGQQRVNEFEHDDRYPFREHAAATTHAAKSSYAWSSALIGEARKYLGTNPTSRKRLWCARFMNFVLAKAGFAGTNSDAAKSFAAYGQRISEPKVGAIAVLTRGRRGGHVGIVTGFDSRGNPILLSGNHGHRVGYGVYSRSRVIAYVLPTQHTKHGPLREHAEAAPVRDAVPQRAAQVVQVAQRRVQQIGQPQAPVWQRQPQAAARPAPVQVAQNTSGKPSFIAEFEMMVSKVSGR
jgi:uncharacterized protein (TIGR02594 family)